MFVFNFRDELIDAFKKINSLLKTYFYEAVRKKDRSCGCAARPAQTGGKGRAAPRATRLEEVRVRALLPALALRSALLKSTPSLIVIWLRLFWKKWCPLMQKKLRI